MAKWTIERCQSLRLLRRLAARSCRALLLSRESPGYGSRCSEERSSAFMTTSLISVDIHCAPCKLSLVCGLLWVSLCHCAAFLKDQRLQTRHGLWRNCSAAARLWLLTQFVPLLVLMICHSLSPSSGSGSCINSNRQVISTMFRLPSAFTAR